MEKKKKLEEIFWKEGKFVNNKGEMVNPKPIEFPKLISLERDTKFRYSKIQKKDLIDYLKKHYKNIDANAVLIGNEKFNLIQKGDCVLPLMYHQYNYSIQFYKI